MSSSTKQVFFITGCSSGLGQSLAQHFLATGHFVAVTARNVSTISNLQARHPQTALALALDVTDHNSISAAISKTVEKFGRIDVLINNAGIAITTSAENYTERELKQVMETNFFGAVYVTQAVLPIMRKQHSGIVIQVSSALGIVALPAASIYSASKFALEGFSEALVQEVASHNIRVVIVEPGTFKTSFGDKGVQATNPNVDDYPVVKQSIQMMMGMRDAQVGDPARFPLAIEKILALEKPPVRIPLGSDSMAMIQGHIRQQQADLEKYKDISTSTDFDPLPEAAALMMKMLSAKK